MDPSILERSPLKSEDAVEVLDILFKNYDLQSKDKFCQQRQGKLVGCLLSLVVYNIFMEHFEEITVNTIDDKHTKYL
jgi:hypothetical protein